MSVQDFYERTSKICAYRIYARREILGRGVAWILQTSTVYGGMLAANIITEDSINPKKFKPQLNTRQSLGGDVMIHYKKNIKEVNF
jgi:hypothetical protein